MGSGAFAPAVRAASGRATARGAAGRAGRWIDRAGREHLTGAERRDWESRLAAARDRIAARRPAGCPTPGKPAYDLDDDAELHVAGRAAGPGRRLYTDCPCGHAHWTTRPPRSRVRPDGATPAHRRIRTAGASRPVSETTRRTR